MTNQQLLTDLAKAKAVFQLRAIQFAMGINPSNSTPLEQCPICGDHHAADAVPFPCETGDGV